MLRFIVEENWGFPDGTAGGRTHTTFTDVKLLEEFLTKDRHFGSATLIGCEIVDDEV